MRKWYETDKNTDANRVVQEKLIRSELRTPLLSNGGIV